MNSVQDRCAYSLMSGPSVPDFHVQTNFQERRRKDVSFLDSVTLRLDGPGVHIHLEQGGRVRVSCLQPQSCVSVDPKSSLNPLVCQLSSFFSVTLEAVILIVVNSVFVSVKTACLCVCDV